MLTYCLKCKKKKEKKNPRVAKANNGKLILLSKLAVCDSKNSRITKNQETSGLLCNLGLKTPK